MSLKRGAIHRAGYGARALAAGCPHSCSELQPAIDPASGALAGFSSVVSALPAYRAARLRPVQALRYQ